MVESGEISSSRTNRVSLHKAIGEIEDPRWQKRLKRWQKRFSRASLPSRDLEEINSGEASPSVVFERISHGQGTPKSHCSRASLGPQSDVLEGRPRKGRWHSFRKGRG